MNTDVVQGNLKELKGELKQTWSKLTDDDINYIDGGVDQFIGKVQKTYGFTKERAMEEFDRFKNKNSRFFNESARTSIFSGNRSPSNRDISDIKDRASHYMHDGAEHANEYVQHAKRIGTNVAHRASEMVKERPGYTLLGAAAVGFLLGTALFRRGSSQR